LEHRTVNCAISTNIDITALVAVIHGCCKKSANHLRKAQVLKAEFALRLITATCAVMTTRSNVM
jgi:hypothetical protein